jgi:hypothetical protein
MGLVGEGQEMTTYQIIDILLSCAIIGLLLIDRMGYDD